MAEIRPLDILTLSPGPAYSATSDMPVEGEETSAAEVSNVAPPPENEAAAVETPSTEGESGEGGAEGEAGEAAAVDPPAPRDRTIRGRMSELTAEKKVEIAKREAAEAHALRLEALLADAIKKPEVVAEPPKPEPIAPPAPDPRPTRDTFDTPEAYDEALIEWSTKRTLQVAEAERATHDRSQREIADREAANRTQQDGWKTIQDAWTVRRAAAVEKMPDYAEVAERADLQISVPMAIAIMQSDDGPAATYYLGKHPEVAERISAMVVPNAVFPAGHQLAGQPVPDVQRQLIELGKVFAAVAEPAAPTPKPEPAPPPAPISPLRRGNQSAVTRSLEELGADTTSGAMENYARERMQQLQAERRRVFGRPN